MSSAMWHHLWRIFSLTLDHHLSAIEVFLQETMSILTFSDLGEVGVAVGDAARVPHHGVVAGEAVDGGELLLVGRHS